jgi:putative tributyrin esterase
MVSALAVALLLAKSPAFPQRIGPGNLARSVARDDAVESKAVGRTMKYRVLLPRDYDRSRERYRVLYLLHGLAGNYTDWSTRTDLARFAAALPLVIVMPEGENAWSTNAAGDGPRFEDYIAVDLVADVEQKYRVIRARYGRAIAGLSMGGYGAVKIALRHPATFAAAGSFSGAFVAVDPAYDDSMKGYTEELYRIFGPPGSETRASNDVVTMADTAATAGAPQFFVGCGAGDNTYLLRNRDLVAVLQKRGFRYEFHEVPGGHSWDYWNRAIEAFLPWLMTVFDRQ